MNGKSSLVRYTAPGLPNWPVLWFDPNRKRAFVKVRVATWRSWVRAHRATRVVRWLLNFSLGWQVWEQLAFIESLFGRGFWVLMIVGMFTAAAKPWMHAALDGFFARNPLAVTTTFWFNPQAVAFKSRMYTNGVVIWRAWRDRLVHLAFSVDKDPHADNQQEPRDTTQQEQKRRRLTACYLRLTIELREHDHMPVLSTLPHSMREIPVLELDQDHVSAVAMVLMTASALTEVVPDQCIRTPHGIDIDTVSP